ncbi:hypothetical protein LTR57_008542 [Friedmanniomyces endolithicus]|nr:hypothetical protein LTR57_008542 [Friedmanniomyces endolithicus]
MADFTMPLFHCRVLQRLQQASDHRPHPSHPSHNPPENKQHAEHGPPAKQPPPLAQRRLNRRNNLPDPSATHAQHAETWQHYVKVHDAFFEECADEIREEFRMREGGEILAARPTRVVFGRVDYQQSASGRASGCDEPVSPKSSVPVALGSGGIRGDAEEEGDEYLERYYTLADVGPFDVEAQVGLPVHRDEVVSASLKRFREIIRGAMAGNLWK